MATIKLTERELRLLIDHMCIEMDWGDSSVDPEYGIYDHEDWVAMDSIRCKCEKALDNKED